MVVGLPSSITISKILTLFGVSTKYGAFYLFISLLPRDSRTKKGLGCVDSSWHNSYFSTVAAHES